MAIPDQGLTSFTWIRHRRVLGPASAGPRESPAGRRPFAHVPPAHRQRLAALEAPPVSSPETEVRFVASGAAQRWHIWQSQERRRLGILAARARLAGGAGWGVSGG